MYTIVSIHVLILRLVLFYVLLLYYLFYPENDNKIIAEKIKTIRPVTPAECIQIFQTYPDNYIDSLDNLCNKNISFEDNYSIKNIKTKSRPRSVQRISKKIQLDKLDKNFNRISNRMESIFKKNIKMINNYNKQKRKLEADIQKEDERAVKKRKM